MPRRKQSTPNPTSGQKVEHVFDVVKKQLRFLKTRYRGIEKQRVKFNIMFALVNLILVDRSCLAA